MLEYLTPIKQPTRMPMLKRSISSLSMLFASTSAILGSGWLFAAFYTAQLAGPGAFLAWILGGFAVIVIAYTYAEMSAMIPVTGSTARIPRYTHGTIVSFIYSLIIWLSYIALAPTEVQAVIQYLDYFFPHLTHIGGALTETGYLTAGGLMLLMTVLNLFSIRWLIRSNNILTIFKIVIPVFICIVLLSIYFTPAKLVHPLHSSFLTYGMHGVLSAISTGGIVFAFNGFKQACEMAGEAKKPSRAIPLAVIGSVVICLVIYLLLQMTLFSTLQPSNIIHGWKHLMIPGADSSPFAGLIHQSKHFWLIPILYVGAVVGPLAAGLMYISSSARSLFAMSKNDYLPKFFEVRNKHGHPWVAVILCFVIGMLTFAPLPGWRKMISFLASLMAASYVITPIALLTLRKLAPNYKRPFKLPFATVWATAAFYFCNLLSYWTGWDIIWKMEACLAISVIILFIYHYGTKRGRELHLDFKAAIWVWPYFSGMALISYLGSFGGRNIIPFGWDMVTLLIFSIIIMYLAVRFCLHEDKTQAFLDKLKHAQEIN